MRDEILKLISKNSKLTSDELSVVNNKICGEQQK